MRAGVLLVLLLGSALLLASPGAMAKVTVEDIRVPERTAADRVFGANVTLRNDGPARTIYLFAALYDRDSGGSSCGPATGSGFRRFTHLVQEPIDLPAGATVDHPAPGERWQHRYGARDAPPAPTVAEFCVFVANVSSGPLIEYESFGATPLSVRARNAAPTTSIERPDAPLVVAEAVDFSAQGSDAEGDPLTFRWDFGHITALGPARAEGERVEHAFPFAGDHVVTLTTSDGIDETQASLTVTVAKAAAPPSRSIPWHGALLACAVLAFAARARIER